MSNGEKRQERCETCKWVVEAKHPQEIGKTILSCRGGPPQVVIAPGTMTAPGMIQAQMQSMFPPVGEDCWCGLWKPKVLVESQEPA